MTVIEVRYIGDWQCEAVHTRSGVAIKTDVPPEYDGKGRSYSSTDLVAAALGTCITSSLAKVAERHDLDLRTMRVRVLKEISAQHRRIGVLEVHVYIAGQVDSPLQEKLRRAAHACPVHKSLHPEVDIPIFFHFPED